MQVLLKDESGHPDAAKFAGVHQWNAHNEHEAVRGVQRHFNRKRDSFWPDLSKGTEATKIQRAKEAVNKLFSRTTKITYTTDTRGTPVVQFRTHLPGSSVPIGPNIKNGGTGVMYSQNGLLHMIDRDRPEHVLKADQAAHAAKMEARRQNKVAQSGPQTPVQSTSEAVNK